MSDVVIRAEGLGKRYRIRHQRRERYTSLRDVIADKTKRLFAGKAVAADGPAPVEDFWALRDVSFEVKRGEVLGIIGRNGAGKSTLLKILSRITEPTTGRVTLDGRVASLLEVGTGFHPELTGRENISLNGAILGMSGAEIVRKFDEIVDFAGVERFLDTPVKHYSSGMYVRLAFAVAAHLEPEILVVDEVLAVGDTEFQRKCLGKMDAMVRAGARTILFVSHNVATVKHLCERVVLLQGGILSCEGPPERVISRYMSEVDSVNDCDLRGWADRTGSGAARIVRLRYDNGCDGSPIVFGGRLRLTIEIVLPEPVSNPIFGVMIHDATGTPLSDIKSTHEGFMPGRVFGHVEVSIDIDPLHLYPGRYLLSPWLEDATGSQVFDWLRLCAAVEISAAPGLFGDMRLKQEWGKFYVPTRWRIAARD